MSDHNIIQLPDALERRATKARAADERRTHGRAEWIEGTIELAIELAGARADHGGDDVKFGKWLDNLHLTLSHQERAILIRWGKEPDKIRPMLEGTQRQSIRMIAQTIFTSTGKDTPPAREEKPSPIRESAKVAIRAHKETTGEYPTRLAAFEKYGVSSIVYERAIGEVTTEDKAAIAPIVQFTKAQERDIEARVEARRRELQASFDQAVRDKVRETMNEILATRDAADAAAVARANEVLAHQWIKPFTAGEYLGVILKALHNDTTTPELRDEAFKLVKSKELSLRLEGRIKPLSSFATPLPKTAEEWEAQKRKAALARKRKPAPAS
jgi:hypothetical protein